MTIAFRVEALEDLEGIASHISNDSPSATDQVIARIHEVIHRTLDLYPESGRRAPDGTHEFAVPRLPYIIVYTATRDRLEVIGIFHTALDPQRRSLR